MVMKGEVSLGVFPWLGDDVQGSVNFFLKTEEVWTFCFIIKSGNCYYIIPFHCCSIVKRLAEVFE
jgi:hypothetical protein